MTHVMFKALETPSTHMELIFQINCAHQSVPSCASPHLVSDIRPGSFGAAPSTKSSGDGVPDGVSHGRAHGHPGSSCGHLGHQSRLPRCRGRHSGRRSRCGDRGPRSRRWRRGSHRGCPAAMTQRETSFHHHRQSKPGRAEATWLQGQEFTIPAQTAPSWKGHTGTATATRGAALKAPRITLGLHTPLLHSEGMNSVFW